MKLKIKKSYWASDDADHWKEKLNNQSWLNFLGYFICLIVMLHDNHKIIAGVIGIFVINNLIRYIWYVQWRKRRNKNDTKT